MCQSSHLCKSAAHGRGVLLAAVLLFAGFVPIRGSECIISDGTVASSCLQHSKSEPKQLVTAKVPLQLRAQWGHAHGYCGEVSVQMTAAHHGVWVGQQLVRDLNGGELLVDDMGSVEGVLDTLGFTHTTWQVPSRHRVKTAGRDYSSHAALFVVWMKQNIAQGRVPIYGAKIQGENDPEYDHIMPAYSVQFWSEAKNSTNATRPAGGSSNHGGEGSTAEHVVVLAASAGAPAAAADNAVLRVQPEAAAEPALLESAVSEAAALVTGWLAAAGDSDSGSGPEDDGGEDETDNDEEEAGTDEDADETDRAAGLMSLPDGAMVLTVDAEPAPQQALVLPPAEQQPQGAASNPHATGWLPAPAAHNPLLGSLTGLYSFSAADVLGWTNGYGAEVRRGVSASGFFANRASCKLSDVAGGCISTDSPSYAVAMGGLVQPTGSGAASGPGTQAADVEPPTAGGLSLADATPLFKPLRLTVTAWSAGSAAASSEPLIRFKASATGYALDVLGCAAKGQPFTVFRFDGYQAFRSTGQKDAKGRPVLANPKSVQELSTRCVASKQACRRATFVQAEGLSVGVKEFGAFSAYGSTYFVCVSGAVPAQR